MVIAELMPAQEEPAVNEGNMSVFVPSVCVVLVLLTWQPVVSHRLFELCSLSVFNPALTKGY